MDEPEVLVEDRGHVRWLKLNRPEAMNAITGDMLGQLNEALKAADDDPHVRVVVLTGAGRAFCAGLDLKQAARGEGIGGSFANAGGARHYSTREICTVTLQRMDKPVIGAINGVFIARFRLPAFMMTLVTLMFFSSAAIWITQSQNIVSLPESFTQLGSGDLVSVYFGEKLTPEIKRRDILPFVTYPMLVTLALALAAHLVLSRTVFGRQVYAVGNNAKAAAISGIPVLRVIVIVFMIAGFCAAVAAILYSARLEGGRPTIGGGSVLLDIIGATVIGGTSLSGGKGKIAWTLIGVLFFVLLSNTLNYMRLSAFHIDVVKGAIILGAALLDVLRTRLTTGTRS